MKVLTRRCHCCGISIALRKSSCLIEEKMESRGDCLFLLKRKSGKGKEDGEEVRVWL